MEWIDVREALPPQGMKVLYWYNGDCWVAWRFGHYWFPLVFADSKHATYAPPQKWSPISFPPPYTGKMFVIIEDEKLDIDELQEKNIDFYEKLIDAMKDHIDSRKEKLNIR